MSDPRNIVDFYGIQYQAQTFHTDADTIVFDRAVENGSEQVGLAVTLSAARTVALAGAGDVVLGKLIKVESDDKATVQTGGYVALASSGAIAEGDAIVGAAGGLIAAGAGRGIVIDASDTENVWVRLE